MQNLTPQKNMQYPCILHWHKNHFVVLQRIRKNIFTGKYKFHIADPNHGIIKLSEFLSAWQNEDNRGIVMFFHKNENFVKREKEKNKQSSIKSTFKYLSPYIYSKKC
ncbi:MAG: hypothetical protein LBH91_05715 [Prevotellaceae bacterium]|nr:hypothetical protein [Prevotellaceae bacterium]